MSSLPLGFTKQQPNPKTSHINWMFWLICPVSKYFIKCTSAGDLYASMFALNNKTSLAFFIHPLPPTNSLPIFFIASPSTISMLIACLLQDVGACLAENLIRSKFLTSLSLNILWLLLLTIISFKCATASVGYSFLSLS